MLPAALATLTKTLLIGLEPRLGTVAVTEVALATFTFPAVRPLKLTVVLFPYPVPEMVTEAPAYAEDGEKPVIVGKSAALVVNDMMSPYTGLPLPVTLAW